MSWVAQRRTSDVEKQHIAAGGQQLQALLKLEHVKVLKLNTWVHLARRLHGTAGCVYAHL